MEVGLRPGELYGLHGHRVDWLRGKLAVVDVMTRCGLGQHPKSKKSHRVVPVPLRTLEGMSVLMAGRDRDALRYAHLAPDAHSKVIESWNRRAGAPVAHAAGKDLRS